MIQHSLAFASATTTRTLLSNARENNQMSPPWLPFRGGVSFAAVVRAVPHEIEKADAVIGNRGRSLFWIDNPHRSACKNRHRMRFHDFVLLAPRTTRL